MYLDALSRKGNEAQIILDDESCKHLRAATSKNYSLPSVSAKGLQTHIQNLTFFVK